MTLAYNLFGIPRTFDEFIDKITKRGVEFVEVIVSDYDDDGSSYGRLSNYHCILGVKAGNTKLKIKEHSHIRLGDLNHSKIVIKYVRILTFKDAVDTAKKLQEIGLEVKINNHDIEDISQDIRKAESGLEGIGYEYLKLMNE